LCARRGKWHCLRLQLRSSSLNERAEPDAQRNPGQAGRAGAARARFRQPPDRDLPPGERDALRRALQQITDRSTQLVAEAVEQNGATGNVRDM